MQHALTICCRAIKVGLRAPAAREVLASCSSTHSSPQWCLTTPILSIALLQDEGGRHSTTIRLRNSPLVHTAFWTHLTLVRVAKGPDEPHALTDPDTGRECAEPCSGSQGGCLGCSCTSLPSEEAALGTSGAHEMKRVGSGLGKKKRWVRVLPVFWGDNYLTLAPGEELQVGSAHDVQ